MKHLSGRLATSITYCVIDCEMTGLDPEKDEIIAIGAVKVIKSCVRLDQAFYRVVCPPKLEMTRENALIHQISHQRVVGGEKSEKAMSAFCSFIEDCVLVGHFSSIDMSFLDNLNKRLGRDPFQQPLLDTRKLQQWRLKFENRHRSEFGQRELQLSSICQEMKIPTYQAHHAFYDALTTACLFLKQLDLLAKAGYLTYRDLHRIAGV